MGRARVLRRGLVLLAAVLCVGELSARQLLGLGDPPLYVVHPTIEYMLKPGQDVRRFGNRHVINEYGMRSGSFGREKTGLRIMVFGDSVVSGGDQIDQKDLATSLVREALIDKGFENVTVGNIGARSWGPGNWLAYVREYGFFGADVVVLVISSHDHIDNPTFAPLSRNHPSHKPVLALQEIAVRYIPEVLSKIFGWIVPQDRTVDSEKYEEEARKSLADLASFLRLAQEASPRVLVFQHMTKGELRGAVAGTGHLRIREVCEKSGLHPISLEDRFRRAIEGGGMPYRDDIHPSALGQRILADAIMDGLSKLAE